MSDLKNALSLYLPLDDVQTTAATSDAGGDKKSVEFYGSPQLVADPVFGSTMVFNGVDDYLNLPVGHLLKDQEKAQEITISFWTKSDGRVRQNSIVGAADANGNRILNVHLPWGDSIVYFDCGFSDGSFDRIYQYINPADFADQWTHWAFTKNAAKGEMKIYLDGELWLSGDGKHKPLTTADFFTLGSYRGGDKFAGQIAHFRVLNIELPVEEIRNLMRADQKSAAAIRKSHPLGFNLFDENDQQALYIADSSKGQKLHLEIHNTSAESIFLRRIDSVEPSETNNHFELKFRPGTLLTDTLDRLTLAEVSFNGTPLSEKTWKIKCVRQANGTVSIYFLAVDPQAFSAFKPDFKLSFTLKNIFVDGRGGARGTRVELKYKNLNYPDDPPTEIKDSGIQHISIVNQRGKKNIPLHVGFVGSNTILNDGSSPNEIILRITNADRDHSIPLSRDKEALSKFIISFDVQSEHEAKEWALMKSGESKTEVSVRYDDNATSKNLWQTIPEAARKQSESPEWIIENTILEKLDPNQSIQIKLSSIISSLPSGQANLYVHYENIPGYWDGQFTAVLEKTNLVQRDQFEEGKYTQKTSVGIGTAHPVGRLNISEKSGIAASHSQGTIVIDHEDVGGASSIVFRSTINRGSDFGYIQYQDNAAPGDRNGESARLIIGIENDGDDHLLLKPSGNVGIGTNNPTSKLHVAGEARVDGALSVNNINGINSINTAELHIAGKITVDDSLSVNSINTSNGSLGIGTKNPEAKLQIINRNQDANGDTLILGPINQANLRLGYHENYGWIHSHGSKPLAINPLGNNVGIGTTDPGARLTIQTGQTDSSPAAAGKTLFISCLMKDGRNGDGGIEFRHDNLTQGIGFGYNTIYATGSNADQPLALQSKGSGHLLLNPAQGWVGIGTTDPRVPLEVQGNNLFHMEKGFWFAFIDDQRRSNNTYDNPVSIKANYGILSEQAFYVTSDLRIKKDLKKSDSQTDLDLLNQLQVTDYRHRDFLQYGGEYKKGFIAQQIEKIFPQAVTRQTGVTSDIYQQAPVVNGWVELTTTLEKGERVKIITESGNESVREVLEATGEKFRVAFESEEERVFVYGREVEDFRILDYQAISVLNVSATQRLDNAVKNLEAKCARLQAANEILQNRLNSLESKLDTSLIVKTAS